MNPPQYDKPIKLILVGAYESGKSALLRRFTDNAFTPTYDVTIGIEFGSRIIVVDGKKIKLQIWDTGGQEVYRSITRAYYRGASSILLTFDICSSDSFKSLDDFFTEAAKYGDSTAQKVLVGCKADLASGRMVSYSEAQQLAQKHDASYIETSALTGENVDEAFIAVARQILAMDPVVPKEEKKTEEKRAEIQMREEGLETVRTQRDQLMKRLEAVEKLVRILGAEGSLLVEGIKKISTAGEGKSVGVDAEGNVKLIG